MTTISLAVVTARLISRIRNHGLSAKEQLIQRDQFNKQYQYLTMILMQQNIELITTYIASARRLWMNVLRSIEAAVGDLVYIHAHRNKSKARDRYLLVFVEDAYCNIRKFVGSQLRNTS